MENRELKLLEEKRKKEREKLKEKLEMLILTYSISTGSVSDCYFPLQAVLAQNKVVEELNDCVISELVKREIDRSGEIRVINRGAY